MIPNGGFRLHWQEPAPMFEDFKCLDDALTHAGVIYATNQGTLTRLENWMGEDACPADQLLPVAMMRADIAGRNAEHVAMENNALYGLF